jgi:hypothetical protein
MLYHEWWSLPDPLGAYSDTASGRLASYFRELGPELPSLRWLEVFVVRSFFLFASVARAACTISSSALMVSGLIVLVTTAWPPDGNLILI